MRPATSLNTKLFAELEIELIIALKHDRAVGRELNAVLDLLDASTGEETWLLAQAVGQWREWNRAKASNTLTAMQPITAVAA